MENHPKNKIINKKSIYFFFLLIVAGTISFPVKTHASGYAIIAFAICWILMGEWKSKWLQLKTNPLSFLFLSYYVLMFIGFFYSEDKNEAKFILEKNMAMFILPLIILSGPKIYEKNAINIGKAFILGCGAISLIALVKGVFLTIKYGNKYLGNGESYFYYKVFGELVGIHMTYFSLYLCFAVLIIGTNTYSQRKNLKTLNIFFRILLCLYFLFFMYLLSTRMAFIAFFIISFSIILHYFYKNGKLLQGILILAISLATILYVFSNLWHTRMRFYYMFHPNTEVWKGAETRNEILNRKVHWGCYLEAVSSSNKLVGVGTGDWWNSIMPCYTRWDFHGLKEKYNAHNQYLETLLRHGIIGLSVWLAILLIPLWLSFKRKSIYYVVFILLFAISCLTETFLDRQHGVVFYAFFNAVLFSYYWRKQ